MLLLTNQAWGKEQSPETEKRETKILRLDVSFEHEVLAHTKLYLEGIFIFSLCFDWNDIETGLLDDLLKRHFLETVYGWKI